MEKQGKSRFFMKHRETRLVHDLEKRKKAKRVDRSGETKNPVHTHFFPFPPFSPVGRSLQAPQTRSRKKEPFASLAFEQTGKNLFADGSELQLHKRPLFQLVFLGDDEDQSVEVKETEEIDFEELKTRLEEGKSVFITTKESEKIELIDLDEEYERKGPGKPWYFVHI